MGCASSRSHSFSRSSLDTGSVSLAAVLGSSPFRPAWLPRPFAGFSRFRIFVGLSAALFFSRLLLHLAHFVESLINRFEHLRQAISESLKPPPPHRMTTYTLASRKISKSSA